MEITLQLDKNIFNDVFFPYLLDYSKRYEVYYGGAGSGKSKFVFQKIAVKALTQVRKVLVVRKTAKSNQNSTYQTLIDTFSDFHLLDYIKINKTTLTVTLPNGSMFLFSGLDDVEKLKSIAGITDIICEECSELTLDDISQLDLRLRANTPNLQMFFMFNPVSKANWTYKRWFAEGAVVGDDTRILQTTYKDNKFLPPEYIQTLEDMMRTNPVYYKIYALGEFASLNKLVFDNWKVGTAESAGELICGLDFGFVNDKTAFIASLLDQENKKLYIFKEWSCTGKTNDEIAAAITSLGFSKSAIIADSAEQKSIEELRRCGIRRVRASVKGKDSVLYGIQKLQQYEIIINPECTETITEFENYSWTKDKNTNEYINKPIDDFNHFIDALRYSLQCANKMDTTINKGVLGL